MVSRIIAGYKQSLLDALHNRKRNTKGEQAQDQCLIQNGSTILSFLKETNQPSTDRGVVPLKTNQPSTDRGVVPLKRNI